MLRCMFREVEILALILSHRWPGEERQTAQGQTFVEDGSLQQLSFKNSCQENAEESLAPQESVHGDAVRKEDLEQAITDVAPLQEQSDGKMDTDIHPSNNTPLQDVSSHSQPGSQSESQPGSQSDSQPGSQSDSQPGSQSDSQPRSLQPPSPSGSQSHPESRAHYEDGVDKHGSFGTAISDDIMWCLCGSNKMDGDVVQCDRCRVWQHSTCADYDRRKYNSFTCVRCFTKEPLACGTTLVIVPESLLAQWTEEIDKHTAEDSLRVLRYRGVSSKYLNPVDIITYNIVLVTYETLKLELYRVQFHEYSLVLRKRKRYSYPPSPLLAICWWRIVLDEAQVVESVTAKAAEMTHRLMAVNRWCVTGTPVQRDLRDLYGLVYFLKWSPYSVVRWWNRLVWSSYVRGDPGPLVALFARLMWRNAKEDVAEELSLPEVKEETHWLTFSEVESYFYSRQQEVCLSQFSSAAAQLGRDNVVLSELDRRSAAKLLAPLHTLRQACCHPQLIKRGGYLPFRAVTKRYVTMEELLKKLVTQAKQEGRESLRQLVAALNGLAGILRLLNKHDDAVKVYCDAMEAWKSYEDHFRCDSLQRIHTMENLARLLDAGHTPLTRTLGDDHLQSHAEELRREYLSRHERLVEASVHQLSVAAASVRKKMAMADQYQSAFLGEKDLTTSLNEDLPTMENVMEGEDDRSVDEEEIDDGDAVDQEAGAPSVAPDIEHFSTCPTHKSPSAPWWMSLIAWVDENASVEELLIALDGEIKRGLDRQAGWSFSTLPGLQLFLLQLADKLKAERQAVLDKLGSLSCPGPLSARCISLAANCHLKPDHGLPRATEVQICDYCQVDEVIKGYEMVLFSRYHLSTDDSELSRKKGTFENLLGCLLSFAKTSRAPSGLCEAGRHHLHLLEAMRKEFKYIRKLWLSAEQRVKACDELNMAAMTFRLASPEEELEIKLFGVQRDPFSIPQNELHPRRTVYEWDKAMFRESLRKCQGQLVFLQNLSQTERDGAGGRGHQCPVCTQEITDKWAVLPCGHSFCLECISTLVHQSSHRHIDMDHPVFLSVRPSVHFFCPMCRERTSSQSINFVNEAPPSGESIAAIKGSYSTKISAVTSTLLGIKQRDPRAKSLVFSCSPEVLRLISMALKENAISHSFLTTKNELKSNLPVFKTSEVVNVLLVFMSFGSKGLNIVEATHVLLVEPSLNIGAELQAIGRVHRLGQTKPITVHRFYVKDTVEERIRDLVFCSAEAENSRFFSSATGDSDSRLTVSELRELFANGRS